MGGACSAAAAEPELPIKAPTEATQLTGKSDKKLGYFPALFDDVVQAWWETHHRCFLLFDIASYPVTGHKITLEDAHARSQALGSVDNWCGRPRPSRPDFFPARAPRICPLP